MRTCPQEEDRVHTDARMCQGNGRQPIALIANDLQLSLTMQMLPNGSNRHFAMPPRKLRPLPDRQQFRDRVNGVWTIFRYLLDDPDSAVALACLDGVRVQFENWRREACPLGPRWHFPPPEPLPHPVCSALPRPISKLNNRSLPNRNTRPPRGNSRLIAGSRTSRPPV
jgi:hypothetical protein